ncbi:MAG TPA: hypothetical protein DEB40_08200 [Elusimicrobia bacterium]|nr:hypothetical protein [Elusimicrobiota bacterium]HBT61710.1 hypothetical protein [Elusimicrobiota bacterium]
MKIPAFALAALTLVFATFGRAAISYSKFVHPGGDYILEYPASWRTSLGLQTLNIRPPGKDKTRVKVSMEFYPLAKEDAQTAEAFIARIKSQWTGIKKLESQAPAEVSGLKAEKIVFMETKPLRGRYGEKIAGPLKEVFYILPFGRGYYVLKLSAVADAFPRALPEFEHLLQNLQLNPPAARQK